MDARRWRAGLVMGAAVLVAASGSARAQQAEPARPAQVPAPRPAVGVPASADPQEAARYQVAMMESVLETAVQRGAQVMMRQWRTLAPDMLLMSGTARARGFRLDGYGVFFVVDVPAMRQSVVWSWRMLERDAGGVDVALQTVRETLKSVTDPAKRKDAEQAIRRLEVQVAPYSRTVDPNAPAGGGAATSSRTVAAPGATVNAAAPMFDAMTDPGEAYTNAVKNALVDAMLDYSHALSVGAAESLTIAARDNSARMMPGDDTGDSITIMLRIKGSDLQAFRAGSLTREDVRKRVEIREY